MSAPRTALAVVFGVAFAALGATSALAADPDDAGLFNPDQGQWVLGSGASPFFYGNPSDTPFMGDWNGDGVTQGPVLRRR
jgi:hypothetical protein